MITFYFSCCHFASVGGSSRCGGNARCDGSGAQAARALKSHQEHGAGAQTLVLQTKVSAGKERYREAAVRAARVHQEDGNPGDEGGSAGEGGCSSDGLSQH